MAYWRRRNSSYPPLAGPPKGWRTERGSKPLLGTRFGLVEHASSGYDKRTVDNVNAADFTIIFATQPNSAGTRLTISACEHENIDLGSPYTLFTDFSTQDGRELLATLRLMRPRVLNIAGNRESVSRGLTVRVRDFLVPVLIQYHRDLVTDFPLTPNHPCISSLTATQ